MKCKVRVWKEIIKQNDVKSRDGSGLSMKIKLCGRPVDRYGLCKKHAAEKDRLTKE